MFTALLDTCVLWPSLQRDFLLSLAAEGIYRPVWSAAILAELQHHETDKLVRRGETKHRAAVRASFLISQMRSAFNDAEVQGEQHGTDEQPCGGSGGDWTCQVYWPVNGTLQTLTYEVQVKATGCYTAQGPVSNVGQQYLHTADGRTVVNTADGRTVVNPPYAFDGWLNTG
jgi:hypothetical protein